ncbi:unnamed protein product [Heligmosomoides polygyrus]|uniref:Lipoprotein n=1 Tax=Heligmosomoides polygyrus TaxID=6339 RepID=A0A183F4W5_HELPZ|nr:unnamed protein product [Heligmosomoides polygyrus]
MLTLPKSAEATTGQRDNPKMEVQFSNRHGTRQKIFEPDDLAWIRDYRAGYPRWTRGSVRSRLGRCLYDVHVQDKFGDDKQINWDAELARVLPAMQCS